MRKELYIKAATLIKNLSGLFLLFLFILPYPVADGSLRDIKYAYSSYEWALSVLIICGFAYLVCLFIPKKNDLPALPIVANKILPISLIALTLLLSAFLGFYCFNFRPHVIDAIVQLWQAKIFSAGQIYSNYSEPISFFLSPYIIFDSNKMYSQYPPGNSIFLSANYLSGIPGLSGLLLAFITLLCLYRFAKKAYGDEIAIINLLLFLCCAFFLFNSQSLMNHVPGLAFTALCLDFYANWEERKQLRYLAGIGASLGFVFICRPLEGALFTILFSAFHWKSFFDFRNKASFLNSASFVATFISVSSLYFLFNYLTTGEWLLSGYIKLWGKGHDLGFHESPWGEQHTLLRGLESFYINLKLLNEYLFESPIPPLSILGLYLLQDRIKLQRREKVLLSLSFAVPFIYVFYWHRDSFMGPRYTYLSLAFLIPLFAKAFSDLFKLSANVQFPAPNRFIRPIYLRNFAVVSVFISVLYILILGLPMRTKVYASSLASMKVDLKKELASESVSEGLIFVKVSWGTRIIASLRSKGVSASLAERAYRLVDHCVLWNKVLSYKNETPVGNFESALLALINEKQKVMKIPLNRDSTLRLTSESLQNLAPNCREEIDYDLSGYSIYEPHLLENAVNFSPPLIVARDMRDDNILLTKAYPEIKNHYLWIPGKLVKLSTN